MSGPAVRPLLWGFAGLAAIASTTTYAADGAAIYARCSACHLPTGKGVPGAFPPLNSDFRQLASKPDGRRYLALVVIKGVSGPLTVEGKSFRGMMPAQSGLDDTDVASVLNHVGTKVSSSGPAFRPFDAKEVAMARAWGSALKADGVGQLHAKVGGK
ncbi:MAG: cytochrome c [Sphingobium sp.]